MSEPQVERAGDDRGRLRTTVWAFINDPAKIATCLPDVRETTIVDAHASTRSSASPSARCAASSTFKIVLEPNAGGKSHGHEDQRRRLRAASSIYSRAPILSRENDTTTILNWKGTASLRGPIATIGGRVVDAQARRVIETTFENVKKTLGGAVLTP